MSDALEARRSHLERQCRDLAEQKRELLRWRAEALLEQESFGAARDERQRDEREREAAEGRIRSLGRLYLALSQTNQAILRIREEPALFQRICDISAEFGEFMLTWIGVEAADRRELDVVASSGPARGALDGIRISTDPESPWGRGPAASAVREGRPVIVRDYPTDPGTFDWQKLANRFGLRANAVLPLRKSGRVIGALAVYSDQAGFFDPEKVALLGEIAGGLGYALESIEREARLLETGQRLLLVTRAARIGIWDLDLGTGSLVMDDRMLAINGLERGDLAAGQEAWLKRVHPEDLARVLQAREAALGGQGEYFQEFRVVHPDGTVRYVQSDVLVVRDAEGRPVRLVGMNRDISERKLAEAALLQEQAFTRALLDNMGEAVVACDGQGKLVMSNRTFQEWHGREILHQPMDQWSRQPLLFEADGTTPLPTGAFPILRALRGEVFQDARVTLRAEGQAPRHLLVNGSPIHDPRGLALGAVAVMHDVTRQRRTDGLVRMISVAVDQSPVAVLITNAAGLIEYVNPKFTEMTGYSASEVRGRNASILRPDNHPPEPYGQLWATITGGEIWKGEFHNKKKNGDLFWESATIAPIKDGAGAITHYVGIKEDITEFKRAEQERLESEERFRELHADLERRVKARTALLERANEELDAFSYSVSHDLRGPLRGIDGFSQALLEDCGPGLSPEGRHYLQRVRAGVLRMGNIIDDLLRLSRMSRTPLNDAVLDLSAVGRAILEEWVQKAPDRSLVIRVQEGMTTRGDPGLIRVVLDNLLGNAVKYSAKVPGASVEFFQVSLPEDTVAFCIRDNGVGFDMAYGNKLFKAFQRLHAPQDFEGTGIGLAIVQRIIHRHGGRVWAEAEPGKGASFFFTLDQELSHPVPLMGIS
jgi:PAS domain S-box-containing protein